jgi:hypothetical protein
LRKFCAGQGLEAVQKIIIHGPHDRAIKLPRPQHPVIGIETIDLGLADSVCMVDVVIFEHLAIAEDPGTRNISTRIILIQNPAVRT